MARRRKAKLARVQRPSWWAKQSEGVQHGLCAAALLALALIFYGPALFSGKELVGGDTRQWRAAAQSMLEYREETGEEPLWATNVFAGMPGYVISPPPLVPQLDYLPRWIRPFAWPVSHFVFLLFGTYLLVWFLWRDKLAALLGSFAFGLTTYLPIILVAGHNTKFVALCFAPWLLLAFAYALRRPGLLSGAIFAIALSIQLRAGHVQITYYLTWMAAIWWLAEGVGAWRAKKAAEFSRTTATLLAGAAAALLMVAELYLPAWEYKAYSIRGMASGGGAGGLDWTYAMNWSQGSAELLTLLIADAFGGSALYWGPKPFTGGPHYVGGVVLLLAALAVWKVRTPVVRALGAGVAVMVLFSLGSNLALLNRPMFEHFPLFDAFRVPETWLIAAALGLALLAAMGLVYIVRQSGQADARSATWRSVRKMAGALVLFVALLLAAGPAMFGFVGDGEQAQVRQLVASQSQRSPEDPQVVRAADELIRDRLVEPRKEVFTADAVRTLFVLLIASLVLALFCRGKLPAWAMQAGLVLLVAVDLGGVGRRYFGEEHLVRAGTLERPISAYDVDQYILAESGHSGGSGHFRVLSLEQRDQTQNGRPSFFHESLGGYSGAKLRLYQDFLENMLTDPATGMPSQNALDMLNTRYVVAPGPIPGLVELHRGEQSGLLVLENPRALPRAYLVGEVETIPDAEETWSRLRSSAFEPGRTAILHAPLDTEIAPIDSSSTASAELLRHGPREMAWEVETDGPRLLVISEVYYPAGWKASIDGVEAPIMRANHLLRAVVVPAGAREVVLRFDPASRAASSAVSAATTVAVYLVLLGLAGVGWFRRRRGRAGPGAT